MARQPGYYWVKFPGWHDKEVAEWTGEKWYRTGVNRAWDDFQFEWLSSEKLHEPPKE